MKKPFILALLLLACLAATAQKVYSNKAFWLSYDNTLWEISETAFGDESQGNYVVVFTNTGDPVNVIGITEVKNDMTLKEFAENQLKTNTLFAGKCLAPLREKKVGDRSTLSCLYEYSNEYGSGRIMAWFFKEKRNYLVIHLNSGNNYTAGQEFVGAIKEHSAAQDALDEARIVKMYRSYNKECKRGKGYKDENIQDIFTDIDPRTKEFVYGHKVINSGYIDKVKLLIAKGHNQMVPTQEDLVRLLQIGYTVTFRYYDMDMNILGEMTYTKSDL